MTGRLPHLIISALPHTVSSWKIFLSDKDPNISDNPTELVVPMSSEDKWGSGWFSCLAVAHPAWQLPASCNEKNKTNLHFRKSQMVCGSAGTCMGGRGYVIISLLSGRCSMDSEQPI